MEKTALQFHIEHNDCLGTLATVVDLASQSLEKRRERKEIVVLAQVRDALIYLQEHYVLTQAPL
jgi:hypothetical protein